MLKYVLSPSFLPPPPPTPLLAPSLFSPHISLASHSFPSFLSFSCLQTSFPPFQFTFIQTLYLLYSLTMVLQDMARNKGADTNIIRPSWLPTQSPIFFVILKGPGSFKCKKTVSAFRVHKRGQLKPRFHIINFPLHTPPAGTCTPPWV